VPICEAQQLDCREEDLVHVQTIGASVGLEYVQWLHSPVMPLFRHCDTARAHVNDGLIKLPGILSDNKLQFIVQLQGCPLDCHYCYVTRAGVHGEAVRASSDALARIFSDYSRANVFHLMGGAPALYLEHWPELVEALRKRVQRSFVFHSDFLLTEGDYDESALEQLRQADVTQMYAVNIKGATRDEYSRNTRTVLNSDMLWSNLWRLIEQRIPFYLTFTGMPMASINKFLRWYREHISTHVPYWFPIPIVPYLAIEHAQRKEG